MEKKRNVYWWVLWLIVTAGLSVWLGYTLIQSDNKTVFMPGPLSAGHHQLAETCIACHSEPFGGGEVLQSACIECHGDVRKKPFDSHPKAKFTDPRNADLLLNIEATRCTTCHVEHKPEITKKMGLTQKGDFCFYCHKDIGKDRPSHAGMDFNTCSSAGCHNFHNNRALYTDFLLKHADEPYLHERARIPERDFLEVLADLVEYPHEQYPVKPLNLKVMDAPPDVHADGTLQEDWLDTAHANIGANCSACHVVKDEENQQPHWTNKPDHTACASCHSAEVKGFLSGKHGMRLKEGLSPMTPDMALLPMRKDAAHKELSCTSCHQAHRFDTRKAAAESCLVCHADDHSKAYLDSPHYKLWQQELAGEIPAGSGVSCATCHMPRIEFDANDWTRRILVEHNQNATLMPNEKMIRPTCMQCHGLGFSIDALADKSLIKNNFVGKPTTHIRSIEMAKDDKRRADAERAEAGLESD